YPLELKLFEDSINERIELMKADALTSYNVSLDASFSKINANEMKGNTMESKKTNFQNEIDATYDDWQKIKKVAYKGTKLDEDGKKITYTYLAYPPEYKEKQNKYLEVKERNQLEIDNINIKIKELDQKIKNDETVKNGFKDTHTASTKALNDLSARMEAFSELKADPKKKSIATASLFIMILLVIIEISPVLFKMMIASGDYDVILKSEKNEIEMAEIVRISEKNDWANTEITKMVEENKKKIAEKQNELNTELASNEELLRSIAKAQSEIAQVAIQKWKDKEIEKAGNNPSDIIQ
ncbi:MAG: DUF4407 domain-containing protein, partial [Bacteroidetes bacterium]|nr:DUF4407 domain-containing protein [Bacteroidota bacterium]